MHTNIKIGNDKATLAIAKTSPRVDIMMSKAHGTSEVNQKANNAYESTGTHMSPLSLFIGIEHVLSHISMGPHSSSFHTL